MSPTLVFDRSDRTRVEISGPQAVATLNGLVTNDVAALKPGHGQYAAALTARGKMVADLRILMHEDRMLVDTSAAAGPGLLAMFTKFINPRFATLRDVSDGTATVSVVGDQSADVISGLANVAADTLRELPVHGHATYSVDSGDATVIRLPGVGRDARPGYDVIAPRNELPLLLGALRAADAVVADGAAWDTLRIESGIPMWGIDMDETTLPQEANMDELHAVSYTKGCYIGQETVARIHFRGHVNRTLRRLGFVGDVEAPHGAALLGSEHQNVGDVRSVARSGVSGVIGIGMVRREVEDGITLDVHWEDGGVTAATVLGKAKGAIE